MPRDTDKAKKGVTKKPATPLTPEDVFGRVVREKRMELGLTQADLEEEGVLERSYISRIEAGKTQVCLRGILHLSRVLGMTPSQLMQEVEKRIST